MWSYPDWQFSAQVDKQGQMLNRELTALHKKVDAEDARRAFVTRWLIAQPHKFLAFLDSQRIYAVSDIKPKHTQQQYGFSIPAKCEA